MLGIIGAMEEEVEQLFAAMEIEKEEHRAMMDFKSGKLEGKDVVVVRSGIGKVNAAVCTQILIDDFGADHIINTGLAGSLKPEVKLGNMVISSDAVHHDVDAVGFGYALGQVPRMKTVEFVADEAMIECAKKACENIISKNNVHVGRIVSGDQFISDVSKKEEIISNFGGYCTEMEGASIAQVAYINAVPFVILRAISDNADESSIDQEPEFEKNGLNDSAEVIKEFVKLFEA